MNGQFKSAIKHVCVAMGSERKIPRLQDQVNVLKITDIHQSCHISFTDQSMYAALQAFMRPV